MIRSLNFFYNVFNTESGDKEQVDVFEGAVTHQELKKDTDQESSSELPSNDSIDSQIPQPPSPIDEHIYEDEESSEPGWHDKELEAHFSIDEISNFSEIAPSSFEGMDNELHLPNIHVSKHDVDSNFVAPSEDFDSLCTSHDFSDAHSKGQDNNLNSQLSVSDANPSEKESSNIISTTENNMIKMFNDKMRTFHGMESKPTPTVSL